jgi:hypothetical protein
MLSDTEFVSNKAAKDRQAFSLMLYQKYLKQIENANMANADDANPFETAKDHQVPYSYLPDT